MKNSFFSAAEDFSIRTNSMQVWKYRYGAVGGDFNPFTEKKIDRGVASWNHNGWQGIYKNQSDLDVKKGPELFFKSNKLVLHPGDTTMQLTKVVFVAPKNGIYQFSGTWKSIDEHARNKKTNLWIYTNADSTEGIIYPHTPKGFKEIYVRSIEGFGPTVSFDNEIILDKGEVVSFEIGNGGDRYHNDSVEMELDIRHINRSNKAVLTFDGANDYVKAEVDIAECEYTTTIWFKTTHPNCGLFSVDAGILGANGHDRHLYLKEGNIYARVWNNEVIGSKGLMLADGRWHCVSHVMGVSIKGQELYIDGMSVAKGSKMQSDFGAQNGINLGYSNDAVNPCFIGEIALLSVWDKVRSQRELMNYREAITGTEKGLKVYWNFEGGKDNVLKDKSKNKIDGIIKGGYAEWNKVEHFTGTVLADYVAPKDLEQIKNEVDLFESIGSLVAKVAPPDQLDNSITKKPLSQMIVNGELPYYDIMLAVQTAIDNSNDGISLTKKMLGPFGEVGQFVAGILDLFVEVKNPKVVFVKGTPGMTGQPGMEVIEDPQNSSKLASPLNHRLKFSGEVKLLNTIEATISAEFFLGVSLKGWSKKEPKGLLPHCTFTFQVASGTEFGLANLFPDTPIINAFNVSDFAIIVSTAPTLYNPKLDSGVVKGLNTFGGFEIAKSKSKELRWIGDLLGVKKLAFHSAIDVSNIEKPALLFEMAVKRSFSLLDTDFVKLTFSRSDISIELKGIPIEPTIAMSNDIVLSLKQDGKWIHIIMTGGVKFELESMTGFFTMNGTGRSVEIEEGVEDENDFEVSGRLSGETQNTTEWRPLAFMDIDSFVLRQLSIQVGATYAGTGFDNIGIHANMKIGNIDGSMSVLVDVNDPDNFVLAGSTDHITMLEALSCFSYPTFVFYENLPDPVKKFLNKVIDVVMEDVKVNIVPVATSIGAVHFRDTGVTLAGRFTAWGWEASAYLNIDLADGLVLKAQMDPVNILDVFTLTGAGSDPCPIIDMELSTQEQKIYLSTKLGLFGHEYERKIDASIDGFEFKFEESIGHFLETNLACSYRDYDFKSSGHILFHLDCSIPTTLGAISLADISFNAEVELNAGRSAGFYMKIAGSFQFYGSKVKFPTLKKSIPPAHFEALYHIVIQEIKDKAEEYLLPVFEKLEEWATAVGEGLIEFSGEVANVAKDYYNAHVDEVVAAYQTLEQGADKIAYGLNKVYGFKEEAIASALKELDYPIDQIGKGLEKGLGTSKEIIGKSLQEAKFAVEETGEFIKGAYDLAAPELGKTLIYSGYKAEEVQGYFKGLGGEFVDVLDDLGDGILDVGKTVFKKVKFWD
ncbi:MAG: LamG domain-containing protein [Aureispira sp.]|nr:LamG domain-containing protein [Aureispira sp.]